jgi:hypothetical protein
MLKIGSAPGTLLLYKPADRSTLAVPAAQVIVVNNNPLCSK